MRIPNTRYQDAVERVNEYLKQSQWNIDLSEIFLVEVDNMENQWGDPLALYRVYYGDVMLFSISFQYGGGGWNHEEMDRFLAEGHPVVD
jgi:hypothetical protein